MRLLKLAATSLILIVVTLLIAGAVSLAVLHAQGQRLLSVQTGSMIPAFRPGDALIIGPVRPNQLHIGDIISYQNPREPRVVITHRLTAIDKQTGWLTTSGDALHSPDPAFSEHLLIGRAMALAPRLGYLLSGLHQPISLALGIYLPAILIVVTEVQRLTQAYARPFYSVRL